MPGLKARFVSTSALIRMKEAAGRPSDVDNIKHLRWILEESDGEEPEPW